MDQSRNSLKKQERKCSFRLNILAILAHNLNTLATWIIRAPKVLDKEGANVNTVFCPPSICMPDPENSKNVNFSPGDRGNIQIDMIQSVQVSEHPKCHFRSKRPKCHWLAQGWPKVKIGLNHYKKYFLSFYIKPELFGDFHQL